MVLYYCTDRASRRVICKCAIAIFFVPRRGVSFILACCLNDKVEIVLVRNDHFICRKYDYVA